MMEINIKMMSEVAYITLQKNPAVVYQNILRYPTNSLWIKEYLGFEPYETKEYKIEDFELLSDDALFENSVLLYEHLKQLPRYILCDSKFWAWIIFEKAYVEAQKISPISDVNFISSVWLIDNSRRSLMLGIISRFFFLVQMSIDESKVDKYELTRYLLFQQETYRNFCFRNIGMLKNVTLSVIRAQKDVCERFHITLSSKQCADMIKEASKIGSVMLIDIMSKEEIYDIIYPKFVMIAKSSALN